LPIDHADTFLDLISSLNEPAILILKYHDRHDHEFEQLDRKDSALKEAIEKKHAEKERESKQGMALQLQSRSSNTSKLDWELRQVQEKIKHIEKYRQASFYNLLEDDFLYLKQILVSKALLIDSGVGSIGHIPYFHMRITLFGKQFINYISEGKYD
jgi:hypothetical protein